MRKLLLLRPEPGLAVSAARARSLGVEVIACPLFRVEPVDWEIPDPSHYDAILLTSANAVRQAGLGLSSLKILPVHAVGEATAAAAREAGFRVEAIGGGDVGDLLAGLPDSLRLLHLTGENHRGIASRHRVDRRFVYRSIEIEHPQLPPLGGLVAAVHSPRAGARLAELADRRGSTAIAAISATAAAACGTGWERVEVAERPDDPSLLALAVMLCHTSGPR